MLVGLSGLSGLSGPSGGGGKADTASTPLRRNEAHSSSSVELMHRSALTQELSSYQFSLGAGSTCLSPKPLVGEVPSPSP